MQFGYLNLYMYNNVYLPYLNVHIPAQIFIYKALGSKICPRFGPRPRPAWREAGRGTHEK